MAISRHELKSDQFVSTLDNWYEFYLNYQKQIVIGAIIAAVVIAAAYGGLSWYRNRNAQAEALLSTGLDALHAPLATAGQAVPPGVTVYPSLQARAQAARKSFQACADAYGNSQSGREARYYLGLTEIDLGHIGAAEADLRAVAASGDARVATLADNALANLYASEGKNEQAKALLQKLIAQPSLVVPRAMAMMELAQLEAATNPAAASQLYQQIQRDYPDTQTAQKAQANLAALPQ